MAISRKILWDESAAAHLLRRAGFGGSPEDAKSLAARGLQGAVNHLLAGSDDGMPLPQTDPREQAERRRLQQRQKGGGEEARRELGEYSRGQREIFDEVRHWWLRRMLSPAHSVREKLTLFWHGHFATSQTKVRFNHAMLVQNQTIRRSAAGPFRELCEAMARDPAMLIWLDGTQSRGKAPNENFAREAMELFVLGEGNYTEDDIREAARAFTGWTVRFEDGAAEFQVRRHDAGAKTLFGQTGNFGTKEAVDILCARPQCAGFLARKLWEFYAYADPDKAIIDSLAAHYRANDLRTDSLLSMIFTHPEFYSARSKGTQVKSPVQWLVQASRELGRQLLPPRIALPLLAELGQNLFMPPSVKGWDGGTSWINSATLIRRSNTALLFAVAAPPLPSAKAGSMNAAAWQTVAPADARKDAASLQARLVKVFLAVPPAAPTVQKLSNVLAAHSFPCGDDAVREASVVLLASPEYNLC